MKKLNDEIKSPKGLAGFTLRKKYEDDSYYIFEKVNTELGYEAGFELFERKVNTMFNCETIPGPEAFGVWAWQFPTYDKAIIKLNSIKNEKTKSN